ncbi:MAG: fimbria major subunit [Prevotella sp.]|nr:fimbria major subunit [Prevotella sp.]
MKKLSFLAMAVAGMLFAACSSDKDVAEVPQNPLETAAEGYFKVNVNLPSQVVTTNRAAAWETEEGLKDNDGETYEYAVDNILLLLFEGTQESDATLFQVIDLNSTQDDFTDTPNQITTQGKYVAKISKRPSTNKSFFALAVVNGAGVIEHGSTANSLRLAGSADKTGIKLSDIQAATAKSTAVDSNPFVYKKGSNTYIFMTNAVLSKVQGGSADPGATPALQVLAPVNATYIYDTEEAASATSAVAATEIYVERGVAKVTLNTTDGNYLNTDKLTAKTGITLSAVLSGWSLDGTNASSYIARQVPEDFKWNLKSNATEIPVTDAYRFIGLNKINGVDLYRTYWAKDPNYNTGWASDVFNSATTYTNDKDAILYAFENTFTVAQMKTNNTTRAILKVKLTSGTDPFYTIGDDRTTLYTEGDVKDKVVSALFNQSAFINYWNKNNTTITTLKGSDVEVTLETGAGKVKVTEVKIPKDKFSPAKSADVEVSKLEETPDGIDGADAIAVLNNSLKSVERFVDGEAYYVIRVKHFGDNLTPWNTDEYGTGTKPAEGDVDAIYPTGDNRDANYLGRYGMVRNNWYDLQIGKILKIGYSTPPSLNGGGDGTTPPDPDDPGHPDDELGLYIMAKINILSWAKRLQSWDLK